MAEVAKLGIEVDASSASIAKAKLLDMANAGQIVGAAFRQMTANISAQVGALTTVTTATDKLAGSTRPLNQALNLLAPQLGLLGPVGNIAGNMFLDMANGIGRTSIAAAGAVVGIQGFANALRRSREEAQNFGAAVAGKDRDFFSSGIERMTKLLQDQQNVLKPGPALLNAAKGLLGGDTDALVFNLKDKIADYSAQLRTIDAGKVKDVTRAFAEQNALIGTEGPRRFALETTAAINKVKQAHEDGKIGWLEYQATAAGLRSLSFANIAEFNRDLTKQIELVKASNDPLKQLQITLNDIGRRTGGGAQFKELETLQINLKKVEIGTPLVSAALGQLGVTAPITKAKLDELGVSAFNLQQKFQAGLISAKQYTDGLRDVGKSTLPASSQTLLGEVDKVKKSLSDIAQGPQLQSTVFDIWTGKAVPTATPFDALQQKISDIKQAARIEFGLEIPGEITAALSQIESQITQIKNEKLVLDLNTAPALGGINSISASLDQLRAKAAEPIVITTTAQTSGSPTLSFSDYWQRYAPGVLRGFADEAGSSVGLTLDSGVLSSILPIVQRLGELQRFTTNNTASLYAPGGAQFLNPNVNSITQGLDAEARFLMSFLRRLMGAPGGTAGTGAGSGGNTFIFDARGATFNSMTLDDALLQYERTILRTTGQDPKIRVTS